MDCVATCPVKGALKVSGPVLLGFPVADGAVRTSRKKELAKEGR